MTSSWLKQWLFRIASITGTHTIGQVLNGVVAFVLIRTLPKDEFAWYTIATGMAAVLNSLNDGGIASAVTAQGGGVWQDRPRFSALLHAAFALLNRTATFAATVVTPILIWLLWEREAPTVLIAITCLLVVGPQWVATRNTVLGTVNRLHSRVREIQTMELSGAFTRSALTLIPAALGWVNLPIALGAVAVSTGVQAILVRRQVQPLLDPTSSPEEQSHYRARIRETLWKMYPNAAFHCLQAQLATALLAIFGSTGQVADLGALARLGFVFTLIGAPLGNLFSPAFARCSNPSRLWKLFLGVLAGYTALLAAFLAAIHLEADLILHVFGPKYHHLHTELFLMALSLAIAMVNQIFWTLNLARGWVRWIWLNIPFSLAAQVSAALLLDVASVRGAILLSLSTMTPALLLGTVVAIRNLISPPPLPDQVIDQP